MTRTSTRRAIAFASTLFAAVALAACTSGGAGASATPAGSAAPAASAAPSAGGSAALEGTLWRLTAYVGPNGNSVPVPGAVAATATFADGKVTGNTGCNDYTAPYTVDGDKLTIGQAAMTRKACGPAETAVETAFAAALGQVATYAITGDTLELRTAAGAVGLTFTATKPAGLTGTNWVATGVNNGSGGVTSVVAGTTLTAIFAADKTVAGSGGCNDFNGPYTSDATSIKIGPLGATKKLCNAPAGVDQQEAQYFAALEKASTYTISGSKLELRDASGALQVTFQGD